MKNYIKRTKAIINPNQDYEMLPRVIQNTGTNTIYFESKLEEYKPNLVEDLEKFELAPGERKIMPHGYYAGFTLQGTATVKFFVGNDAPELKGFKKIYKMRIISKGIQSLKFD